MKNLRVSLLQQTIVEDNPEVNLIAINNKLKTLQGSTDLVIVPELFTTGFTLKKLDLAEDSTQGKTIDSLKNWALTYQIALAGSFLVKEKSLYYNRAFFITPEQKTHFYDKKHLFRMGKEAEVLTPGNQPLRVNYKGWTLKLLICYDLRFPVWSRNTPPFYDLLIYVANWPSSRKKVWEILLSARAIENLAYVIGVNRIGTDSNKLKHHGFSCVYTPKGEPLAVAPENKDCIVNSTLNLDTINSLRTQFPAWKDNDNFKLLI